MFGSAVPVLLSRVFLCSILEVGWRFRCFADFSGTYQSAYTAATIAEDDFLERNCPLDKLLDPPSVRLKYSCVNTEPSCQDAQVASLHFKNNLYHFEG